jgi:hypothetical protein
MSRPSDTQLVRALGQFAFSPTYRETEYFTDWVRPQGYGDMIGGHLVRRPDLYAATTRIGPGFAMSKMKSRA